MASQSYSVTYLAIYYSETSLPFDATQYKRKYSIFNFNISPCIFQFNN